MKNYDGPLYAPWSAVVKGRGFDPVEARRNVIDDNFRKIAVENHLEGVTKLMEGSNWEESTKLNIAKNLLNHIAELLDGKWHRSETLDYKGRRTERFIIERDITEGPDSSESDVSGSDSSDT